MPPTFPFAAEDAALVSAAKEIKVLSRLAWPADVGQTFLAAWRRGEPALPSPPPVPVADSSAARQALEPIAALTADHPAAAFLARTARSYLQTLELLQAAGTPRFNQVSIALYGQPSDEVLPGLSARAAAEHFVRESDALARSCAPHQESDYCLTAQAVAAAIQAGVDAVFDEPLAVVVDPGLASKAAAGADRIRLRAGTCYVENDIPQLLEHEALVHSATARNGRRQPQLTALSLGAPRTTATQEGLATFAELISGSIDLPRLRRLALRVLAVERALAGADFIEVFRFFLEAGYNELESCSSAQRVFRGGDVRGGVAFTKDGVYLPGLLQMTGWLRNCLAEQRIDDPRRLFAGRLTTADVEALRPLFDDGTIAPAAIVPGWVARRENLAAYLAVANLTARYVPS